MLRVVSIQMANARWIVLYMQTVRNNCGKFTPVTVPVRNRLKYLLSYPGENIPKRLLYCLTK